MVELERLTQQAKRGEITSLLFLAEGSEQEYQYGLIGDYADEPERAFGPATKCMYHLSIYINKLGRDLRV